MTGGGNGRTSHPIDASHRDAHTNNLSATIESLRVDFVAEQQIAPRDRQQAADACADDWNAVSASIGSFADEHATL